MVKQPKVEYGHAMQVSIPGRKGTIVIQVLQRQIRKSGVTQKGCLLQGPVGCSERRQALVEVLQRDFSIAACQ